MSWQANRRQRRRHNPKVNAYGCAVATFKSIRTNLCTDLIHTFVRSTDLGKWRGKHLRTQPQTYTRTHRDAGVEQETRDGKCQLHTYGVATFYFFSVRPYTDGIVNKIMALSCLGHRHCVYHLMISYEFAVVIVIRSRLALTRSEMFHAWESMGFSGHHNLLFDLLIQFNCSERIFQSNPNCCAIDLRIAHDTRPINLFWFACGKWNSPSLLIYDFVFWPLQIETRHLRYKTSQRSPIHAREQEVCHKMDFVILYSFIRVAYLNSLHSSHCRHVLPLRLRMLHTYTPHSVQRLCVCVNVIWTGKSK